jgi:hypothetical protein
VGAVRLEETSAQDSQSETVESIKMEWPMEYELAGMLFQVVLSRSQPRWQMVADVARTRASAPLAPSQAPPLEVAAPVCFPMEVIEMNLDRLLAPSRNGFTSV